VGDNTVHVTHVLMAARYITERKLQPKDGGVMLVINSGEEGLGNLFGCRQFVADHADKPEVRRYLSRCFSDGREIIKAIADRQSTILQVARAIVQHQADFFHHGPAALAPLRMEQVAQDTGLHISTISRAVNGKYLKCHWGIFELRHFFTTALRSSDAQAISPEAVQARIRDLIADEDTRHPLSDAKLEQLLAAEGIEIARRTIAKYRDILRIPPASQRKG
jgi:RNA polymerase sigma-54 factor